MKYGYLSRYIGVPRASLVRRLLFGCLLFGCLLTGGAVSAAQQSGTFPANTVNSVTANARVPLSSDVSRYRIKLQDVLTVLFPLTPEFNQTVTVQPDGYISLNGAPNLYVSGLTVPELEAALKKDYAETLNKPLVNVDLKDVQRPFFTITGQVGKPGEYELRSNINVAEAVAKAGGLAATAKYQVYVFHRNASDSYNVQKVDLKRLLKGKNLSDAALVHPGDMIVVPESGVTTFRKYVPYSIGASYFPTN